MTAAPVLRSTHVRRPVDEVFALFTDQIGSWWPLPSHGMYGDLAAGVSFVDGKLVERAADGRATTWGEVIAWEPPTRLAITWHPGDESGGPASIVEVTFAADDDGTRVDLSHHGWEVFGEQAEDRRRPYTGPDAWGWVLDLLAARCAATDDTAEIDGLRIAYEEFLAEALVGGFGDPDPGEWTAAQVVAHVAANDDAMTTVCRSIAHGRTVIFDNTFVNDPVILDAVVASADDMAGLVGVARQRSEVLLGLLATLDADQFQSMIHCHLVDHGKVVLDQPMPWGQMALRTQATFHLPLHTRQLRDLRPDG